MFSTRQFHVTAKHLAVFVIASTVILAYVFVDAFRPSAEQRAAAQARERLIGARLACQQFVRDRLLSPSTATFGATDAAPLAGASTQYRVAGYYDAQNIGGAMLRGRYVCETRLDGEKWLLARIDLPQ